MLRFDFIEGFPRTNKELTRQAECLRKVWEWRKVNYVPLAQRIKIENATVRETPAEEVMRRLVNLKRG